MHRMADQPATLTLWDQAVGLVAEDLDPSYPLHLYALGEPGAVVPDQAGALFGFVAAGSLRVVDEQIDWVVNAGEWFATRDRAALRGSQGVKAFAAQRLAFSGLYARGGPIEPRGRLRYIDGCSDSLLCGPPVAGDPCLNLLHFPPGIEQTMHTHPSARVGIIVSGRGVCRTGSKRRALRAGQVFALRPNAEHAFSTSEHSLNVVAWHPDSDWGPTHQSHPMLNRTWVDGRSVDNTAQQHQAELMSS